MKVLLLMLAHLLTTLAQLLGPGGAKAIVADSVLMKQQLLIINRSRRRAPNLTVIDRLLLGFWTLFLSPHHIRRAAVIRCFVHSVLVNPVKLTFIQLVATDFRVCRCLMSENQQ